MKRGAPGKVATGALLGAGAGLLVFLLTSLGAFAGWERASWDWRARLLARPGPSTPRIHCILLDQASLDWGRQVNRWSWPWPREVYGAIVDFCRRGGAEVVAFDVLFTEPSLYGVADDAAFAAAMAREPNFVGALFLGAGKDAAADATPPPPGLAGLEGWRREAEPDLTVATVTLPIPELARAAAALGNVSGRPDPDGIFRHGELLRGLGEATLPSLGLAAWLLAHPDEEPRWDGDRLHLGAARVPLRPDGRVLLRYPGPEGRHDSVSAAAVLQSELRLLAGEEPVIDPARFAGDYVFFGFSAPGLMDERSTPMNAVSPGVEVHATLLENLLDDRFARAAPAAAVAPFLLLLGAAAGALVARSRGAAGSLLAFALVLPLPALLGLAAYRAGLWWPVVPGTVAALLALTVGVLLNYATEGRQRRFIKQAFRHYLSPVVIERLLGDPDGLRLGGERKELSILFADLAGFTGLSERMEPEALTLLLNAYLSDMTDIVLAEGGTLDKYEGDAFIAFWNAPLDQPDHALRACRAAVACLRRLESRRDRYAELGGEDLCMRVGIHTGEVIVGNMGSRQRFDYSVLGDAANLASRLEGANKAFGTQLLVSDSTRQAAGPGVLARELADLRVVGRREALLVHELLGLQGDEAPAGAAPFEAARRALRAGRREDALADLSALADTDPVARAYLDWNAARGNDWDGVWNLEEK